MKREGEENFMSPEEWQWRKHPVYQVLLSFEKKNSFLAF